MSCKKKKKERKKQTHVYNKSQYTQPGLHVLKQATGLDA